MSERSVTHATFTIERTYDASPTRVFQAFADPTIKQRWFAGPEGWEEEQSEMDFRVGGRETSRGGPKGGPVHIFESRYQDIVPNERIIFAYDMHVDDKRISVSLATVELEPKGAGTRLVFTEQGAFLDGYDDAGSREHGTRELLDALGTVLGREPARA
ncbi:MAG: polyketide cyclase [Chloroflexi bacterium]|nr:MAG: polyketide cyclase [Chloroflexota bacterium]TMF60590.1 MAG: polyketide cyclase [Chloroflexota bacterium]TMG41267.1 MAG: polyketide cyclase [Chloroflexota bacterium]